MNGPGSWQKLRGWNLEPRGRGSLRAGGHHLLRGRWRELRTVMDRSVWDADAVGAEGVLRGSGTSALFRGVGKTELGIWVRTLGSE